ncbi:MAG: right-handed parallel beta-helix repeat-containing protein [Candidatus Bathyarchaeota archaeon]|nr:MAG: right-handed parallel beta-helix repeat-containing protein [Candidatus Bathyarchaeota archaeon]
MFRKIFLIALFAALASFHFCCILKAQPVLAAATILADGSIFPETAPINTLNKETYFLTGNLTSNANGIVVEKNGITLDGKGYSIQGEGLNGRGLSFENSSKIIVTNINIENFFYGVYVDSSKHFQISNSKIHKNVDGLWLERTENSTIQGNMITDNYDGIIITRSSSNFIAQNELKENIWRGIWMGRSYRNNITNNNIAINKDGISLAYSTSNMINRNSISINSHEGLELLDSSNNTISYNILSENKNGILLRTSSSGNQIYGNEFTGNSLQQAVVFDSNNSWDIDMRGNFWSDYSAKYPNANELNGSGVWDTPYVIDENNKDNYPIIPEIQASFIVLLLILSLYVCAWRSKFKSAM